VTERRQTDRIVAEFGLRRLCVVPHTHWDREWYRPFEHFRLGLAQVVDGVLDLLERDPRFATFTLDGQAILLEDYVEIRPENESRLRALLAAGRIEAGPSYVLPDELLVGAESLVRNLLIGRAVCQRFGVAPSAVGYLPDSFGHPLQLPQVLAGFGIETFVFSRGLGDQLDDLGVVFAWRAPDGSEVLAFQQLPNYANFAAISDVDDAEQRIREIAERFGPTLQHTGIHHLLLCNGSDHLPAQAELPDWCTELERRLSGASVEIVRYVDYVSAVGAVQAPAWTGELLGSRLQNVLRGVNSSRLYLKQANQRAESRLLAVETLAALRSLRDRRSFPVSDFTLAWRELLRCQPHDSICGCSCDEVHRDMLVRYESLDRTLSVLQQRALDRIGGHAAGSVGVVNVLPQRRSGLIERPGMAPAVVELDGFCGRAVELAPAPFAPPKEGVAIESDHLRIEAANDGTLALVDKHNERRFEGLHALEDVADMGDLYNFCPLDGAPRWRSEAAEVRVLADGPIVWELEVQIEADRPEGLDREFRSLPSTAPLTITSVVRLVRGSRRVEFRTTIDNRTRDHRLRAVFPVGDGADYVRAEGQFALVRRPLAPARPRAAWVEPPDCTQHTLGAVALGPLALLTKGLPEYEARSSAGGAELCLTMLRCVGVISQPSGVLATRPQGAGPQVPTPDGQCLGRHTLEYALLPDADTLDDTELLRAAQDYRCGFLVSPHAVDFDPPLELEGEVVFSCLKGAEDGDGLVLRCFNASRSAATARVVGDVSVSGTRLDETGERSLRDATVELRGGEVATLRLRAERSAARQNAI
jgi:2-O-(6-phospho-alpha-D-mannosyl)-D-glycerate hydrolase